MAHKHIYFVVGTDTGVGKTVVTTMIIRYLRNRGEHVTGVKPFCSGGRGDAKLIRSALGHTKSLDEINPWHFRAALTPLVAARREGVRLLKSDCLNFLRNAKKEDGVLVIEGAGGLLSPLGEGFDARDLINDLNATPIIVCPNQLGAINQVRLALSALPTRPRATATVALVQQNRRSSVAKSNLEILRELAKKNSFVEIPWIEEIKRIDLSKKASHAISMLLQES